MLVLLALELTVLAIIFIGPQSSEEWIAMASVVNAILVVFLVVATVYYAHQTAKTVEELREGRFAQFTPILRWDQPQGGVIEWDSDLREEVWARVPLLNTGRGPARILSGRVEANTGEKFDASVFLPFTLGPGERITLKIFPRESIDRDGQRTVTLTIPYADAEGIRQYETRPKLSIVNQSFSNERITEVELVDSDERSPWERRR
ncbi:MAG: hypothetical protein ACRDGT_00615 [Candidatus Limnocylindria bacterium]